MYVDGGRRIRTPLHYCTTQLTAATSTRRLHSKMADSTSTGGVGVGGGESRAVRFRPCIDLHEGKVNVANVSRK